MILNVSGMSCSHCVQSIEKALSAINGINSVSVSLENKTVTIEHDGNVSFDVVKDEIESLGFDVL